MKTFINPHIDIITITNDVIATSVFDHNSIGSREQLLPEYFDFDEMELL